MRTLTHLDVLSLWERIARMHPLDGGLAVLVQTCGRSWEELANWPFGRRNQELLQLLAQNYGNTLSGWIPCPQCAEKLEFTVDCDALLAGVPEAATVEWDGLRFRLPSSRALADVLSEQDADRCVRRLLEFCASEPEAVNQLSEDQIERIGSLMADADPLAHPTLAFTCVACGNSWDEALDPMHFVKAEVDMRARRLLREVHHLASAYGWTEQTVFALSDTRRAAYLEMLEV